VSRSIPKKIDPRRVRAALLLAKTSVPQIAKQRGCAVSSLYAVLDGRRPGRSANIRQAVVDMEQIVKGVLCA
jgi:hypothetical protein